jgi:adenosylcobyric acid synthase
MLGREIVDAEGIEGAPGTVAGLGLLDVVTQMKPEKRLALTQATYLPTGHPVEGYEIHIGQTEGPDCARAWLEVAGRAEGAASADGHVMGCYLHGLFAADQFRTAYLSGLGHTVVTSDYGQSVEDTLDALAAHLRMHIDLEGLLGIAGDV